MVAAAAERVTVSDPAMLAPPGTGETAALLAAALTNGDVLFAAADEQRAIAITRALSAAAPAATVLFCPGSGALPGDDTPASPANVGQRVSALRRIRLTLTQTERPPIACITSGEALGRLYPSPAAYEAPPPQVAVGQPVDLATLFGQLEEIGYVADERVDEPGEMALRGQVLAVYPADAEVPLRIEAADGAITSIRLYDPAD